MLNRIYATLFLMMISLVPQFALAQGGGHVGRQQQQQQAQAAYKKIVTRHEAAQKLYEELLFLGNQEIDLGTQCTHAVKEISGYLAGLYYRCYDRGPHGFWMGRYKCYQETRETENFFEVLHDDLNILENSCSGDGIFEQSYERGLRKPHKADW